MMSESRDLRVCVDCAFLIVNGDLPERDEIADQCLKGITDWWDHGFRLIPGSEPDDDFSWSSCDCCNSMLGGTRMHICAIPIH